MQYKPQNVSREIGPDGVEHMYVNGSLAMRMDRMPAARDDLPQELVESDA